MSTYSLSDIVNKSIVARGDVRLYRLPLDSAPVVYTVKSGQTVGVVYSYLLPSAGRSSVYLMFMDNNGRPYYIRWGGGVDKKALEDQGLLSEAEKAAAAAEANKSGLDKALDSVQKIALGVGALLLLRELIRSYNASKS